MQTQDQTKKLSNGKLSESHYHLIMVPKMHVISANQGKYGKCDWDGLNEVFIRLHSKV